MSIRTRLLLLTLLATLLPALLVAGRFLQDRARDVEADTQRLAFMAQRLADNIDEKIHGTAQLLYGLGRAPDLMTQDRSTCSVFLAQVREAYPQYTGILTIKPDGQLFCDSLQTGRELNLRDRAYFKAALAGGDKVVLEPVFGRLTGVPVLQIAYPVRSAQGALQFVLLASLNLEKLVNPSVLPVPGAETLLLDKKGLVLSNTNKTNTVHRAGTSIDGSALFRWVASTRDATTDELKEVRGAPTQVWAVAGGDLASSAGLHVVAGAPRDQLLAMTNRRFAEDMTILSVASLLIFLCVWLLAEFAIRKQVVRITRMAKHLGEGRLGARIEHPLPKGELGSLMDALNHAAESLEQQRTDIERLNSRLRQSQRLEAIGQLTGGIAHDFNNLLTVVMCNADLLTQPGVGDAHSRQLAALIARAAERGAALTQHLLAFARKQTLDPRAVDVNQLVCTMQPILERTLGEQIDIQLQCSDGLWMALVDQGQLENALLNLCLNARDAMPQGGRLRLHTVNAMVDDTDHLGELSRGPYVVVSVIDTGHGIAPEHLSQVFEPFFTTKEKGKGTGLGLAMVYGFVKQSAGHVSIESSPDRGTTVTLYLPKAQGEPVAVSDPRPSLLQDATGNETVMLVEDDELVRLIAVEQLRSLGYQVIEFENGPLALQELAHRDDVDLLFTDMVMPGGMNGLQLAQAAQRLHPALKILYTSGYTENVFSAADAPSPNAHILAKPYRRTELAHAVRKALRAPSPLLRG